MCRQVNQPDKQVIRPDEESWACRENDPRGGWWGKGFGYFGSQGVEKAIVGYDSRIFGTMIGYDMPVAPGTRAGLGIGYARSEIDGKTFIANTDFNTYRATAYFSHERGPWFLQGDLSFGWNDYSGTRHIVFPSVDRRAQATYSGQDYTGYLTTGYHFFAREITITPLASLQYTHMNLDNYKETGAGDISLRVNCRITISSDPAWGGSASLPIKMTPIFLRCISSGFTARQPGANTAAFTAAGSTSFRTQG
jgi:outer membrane autotransporter protein